MLKKRIVTGMVVLACALACLLAFSGCGSADAKDLVGEWKIKNTNVTVVFSGKQFKLVGNTFDYTVDDANKTITYKANGAEGKATYSFNASKNELTLTESDGSGNSKVTVFDKVSSNGEAEPSAGV